MTMLLLNKTILHFIFNFFTFFVTKHNIINKYYDEIKKTTKFSFNLVIPKRSFGTSFIRFNLVLFKLCFCYALAYLLFYLRLLLLFFYFVSIILYYDN
ncbi:hypothetical protein EON70_00060 [bacterium]|nr:MAG: hypothetical protein EON70_00060 [bacterium]